MQGKVDMQRQKSNIKFLFMINIVWVYFDEHFGVGVLIDNENWWILARSKVIIPLGHWFLSGGRI